MYRRIELINHFCRADGTLDNIKNGLCGLVKSVSVFDAWGAINAPRKAINKNVRFYFTEAGWERFGRDTVAACIRSGQEYRVIAREEHDRSIEVVYKDEYQVCLLPRRCKSQRYLKSIR